MLQSRNVRNQYTALTALSKTVKKAYTTQYYLPRLVTCPDIIDQACDRVLRSTTIKVSAGILIFGSKNARQEYCCELLLRERKRGRGPYLSIVTFASTKQRLERVISRDNKTGDIHKEFTGDVEENEEKVDSDEAKEGVYFRNGGLFFQVVEHRIF